MNRAASANGSASNTQGRPKGVAASNLIAAAATGGFMGVQVLEVRLEHHRAPIGIGEPSPRISWRVSADAPGWSQTAYEIETVNGTGESRVSSGRVESTESVLVGWPAAQLTSRERRTLRVRVWGVGYESPSPWSDPVVLEAGLLTSEDWLAAPVSPDRVTAADDVDPAPALFRREFELDREIASARLYVTGHGVYVAEVNGTRIGDHVLAPGWTSYHHRLRYQTFDVTPLLKCGANVLGATVAAGWYVGHVGFEGGRRKLWGNDVSLLAQLEVTFTDGGKQTILTDGDWQWADGPILASGIYAGETYDARLERPGWSTPGLRGAGWAQVRVLPREAADLVAPDGPPIRRIQEIEPAAITTSPSGRTLVDFGQNLVGWIRIHVSGEAGTTITLRHAEVLENGELGTRPIRHAEATDRYIIKGGGVEEWEPQFTYHGFRYAEISGWPGRLSPVDIRAVVVHTDMQRTGWFESSDPLLNRLHENVVWSMRGNFLDVPTDCPQRDERLGWTGDIGAFAPTASFLYDCSGTLASWLKDVAAEQAELGTVPYYVPWIQLIFELGPAAVWGDAAVLVPWTLFQQFGDLGLLRTQYPSMTAWVDQVADIAGDTHLWTTGFQFGDWLDPASPADRPSDARTDKYLVATAYHAVTSQMVADSAAALGLADDARRYGDLAAAIRRAFLDEYVSPNGRLVSDSQTAYALALHFGLLPEEGQRRNARTRLVDLVALAGYRIGTGFVGTPLVCDALAVSGAVDTAYRLLLERGCPSWLYPVTMGATTVWERWDSMLPDGRINPGSMTSFNHYALGAVADWLHRTVAGLAPAFPGYRKLMVAPRPGGGLEHASATHDTPYGRAEVRWKRTGGRLDVDVLVPPGTTATIDLPDPAWSPIDVGPGRHTYSCPFRPVQEDPR